MLRMCPRNRDLLEPDYADCSSVRTPVLRKPWSRFCICGCMSTLLVLLTTRKYTLLAWCGDLTAYSCSHERSGAIEPPEIMYEYIPTLTNSSKNQPASFPLHAVSRPISSFLPLSRGNKLCTKLFAVFLLTQLVSCSAPELVLQFKTRMLVGSLRIC